MILTAYVISIALMVMASIESWRRLGLGMAFGICVGLGYFIILPMGVVVFTGQLPLDIDFNSSYLEPIDSFAHYWPIVFVLFFLIVSFLVLYILSVRSQISPKESIDDIGYEWSRAVFVYKSLLVLFFVTQLSMYFASGLDDGGHWYKAREEMMEEFGLAGVALGYISIAIKLLTVAMAFHLMVKFNYHISWIVLTMVVLCGSDLYFSGNRIFTLQSIIIIFLAFLWLKKYYLLGGIVIVAPVFGEAMTLFRWARGFMHDNPGGGLAGTIDGIMTGYANANKYIASEGISERIRGVTESVNLNVLVNIIKDFGGSVEYLHGWTLLKPVFFFIPRSVWADKPPSIPAVVGEIYCPNCGVAFITTAIGELYANIGVFSIVALPFLLIMTVRLDTRKSYNSFEGALRFLIGFTVIRMAISDMVILAFFAIFVQHLIIGNFLAATKDVK